MQCGVSKINRPRFGFFHCSITQTQKRKRDEKKTVAHNSIKPKLSRQEKKNKKKKKEKKLANKKSAQNATASTCATKQQPTNHLPLKSLDLKKWKNSHGRRADDKAEKAKNNNGRGRGDDDDC
ncbi:hypothetical protein T08_2277 [Trichinella sp. T8]|nr:hypothetical protein T08_2277 [Trichinella sp. T8]